MFNFPVAGDSLKKRAVILGHTMAKMGESTQCLKLRQLMKCPLLDIFQVFGEAYEPLAKLNHGLASMGHAIIDNVSLPDICEISKKIPSSDLLMVLSWHFSIAACLAAGLHKKHRSAVKLYVHHANEKILTPLYECTDLILAESLLAVEKGISYGLDPGKLLYLPHYYLEIPKKKRSSRAYVEGLAKRHGKKINKNTLVVGTVSRLECGKNCEYAIEAVRRLWQSGKDVVLVLKGDFQKESSCPEYQKRLKKLLQLYRREPWLFWDKNFTPFPEVLLEYASFDVLLHPSGAEGASNVVVECLGLNKPVVLLNCSTNPYLFSGLAVFVKTAGKLIQAPLPFDTPDIEDLCEKLEGPLLPPDEALVRERFHSDVVKKKMPLLFERNEIAVKKLYDEERKIYRL